MININGNIQDEKKLTEALKGNYGTNRLSNGVEVFYMGRFVYFEGYFDGSQNVIEIPELPKRVIVHFAGDGFECIAIAEPKARFVSVPEIVKEKHEKFTISAICGLNT